MCFFVGGCIEELPGIDGNTKFLLDFKPCFKIKFLFFDFKRQDLLLIFAANPNLDGSGGGGGGVPGPSIMTKAGRFLLGSWIRFKYDCCAFFFD